MREGELKDILVDENEENKTISLKKIISIGVLIFLLFIGIIFSVKYLNKDEIKNVQEFSTIDRMEDKEEASLFEKVEVRQNNEVSEKFQNIIQNIKKNKQEEYIDKNEQPNIDISDSLVPENVNSNKFIQNGFYIQVGAFYRLKPNKSFLNKLKQSGYEYTLFKSKVNDNIITKVVIGPYESKTDAISRLADVKKVESDAYILRLP